jgi:hypothetical protein
VEDRGSHGELAMPVQDWSGPTNLVHPCTRGQECRRVKNSGAKIQAGCPASTRRPRCLSHLLVRIKSRASKYVEAYARNH